MDNCEWTEVQTIAGVTLDSCDVHRDEFRINDQIVVEESPGDVYAAWNLLAAAMEAAGRADHGE